MENEIIHDENLDSVLHLQNVYYSSFFIVMGVSAIYKVLKIMKGIK